MDPPSAPGGRRQWPGQGLVTLSQSKEEEVCPSSACTHSDPEVQAGPHPAHLGGRTIARPGLAWPVGRQAWTGQPH